jgi:chemotaxis protein MotB
LEDFYAGGVEVFYKDGLLRVQLAEELLYRTGSAMLGTTGKNALGSLAVVLNEYPRLRVIVVGNTDNVKYKKGSDNWTLSTERANGVVRLLNEHYHVDASRLTSAGKAQFNPVAENSTSEGRGQNRRIDIILNPDIERIWNSSGNP